MVCQPPASHAWDSGFMFWFGHIFQVTEAVRSTGFDECSLFFPVQIQE